MKKKKLIMCLQTHVAEVVFLAFNRFMADHDAWRELAEIYVSLQMWDIFLLLLVFQIFSIVQGNQGYQIAFVWCLIISLCFYNIGTSKQHFAMRS